MNGKRTYSKPVITFDSFELSSNIASTCAITNNNQSAGLCGYEVQGFNGLTIFLNELSGCEYVSSDDGASGFCYNIPLADTALFSS